MANITNLQSFLRDVANAIKNKNGSTTNIRAENFDIEINNIQTGTITEDEYAEMLTISQNILGIPGDSEDDTDTTHLQRPAEYLHSFYSMGGSQPAEGITLGDITINSNNTQITDLLENFMPNLTGDELFSLSFYCSYMENDEFYVSWHIKLYISEKERYITISDVSSMDEMGEGFNTLIYYTRCEHLREDMMLSTWMRRVQGMDETTYTDVGDVVSNIDYSNVLHDVTSVVVYMNPASLKTVDNIKSGLLQIEQLLNTTISLGEDVVIPEESDGFVTVTIVPKNQFKSSDPIVKGDEDWWISPVDNPDVKYYIEDYQVRLPSGYYYYFYTSGINNRVNLDDVYVGLSGGRTKTWTQNMVKVEDAVTVTFVFDNPNNSWMPTEITPSFHSSSLTWGYTSMILTPEYQCYVPKLLYSRIVFSSFHNSITNQDDLLNVDLTSADEATIVVKLA